LQRHWVFSAAKQIPHSGESPLAYARGSEISPLQSLPAEALRSILQGLSVFPARFSPELKKRFEFFR
jgi:hypothetical protein